jgi:D-alanyl-D-alanine carboxypeptidase
MKLSLRCLSHRIVTFASIAALALAMLLPTVEPAHALSDYRSAIVVDMNSGKVLFARSADTKRYPASLTKIMTLYVLFGYLRAGKITLDSELVITPHAAGMAPTKLGLKPGATIRTEDAIKALVTKSANDMAAAIAENLAGTESNFAQLMTRKAHELGMTNTVFRNASGLPNDAQVTTARDMAILGERIMRDFPEYYHYFSLKSFTYRGVSYRNHNHLLSNYRGTDGIKTGYTRASGFNLTASAQRDGKHLMAVILGGSTSRGRDATMRYLLDKHFPLAQVGPSSEPLVANVGLPQRRPAFAMASAAGSSVQPVSYRQAAAAPRPQAPMPAMRPSLVGSADAGPYQVQVGAYTSSGDAQRRLSEVENKAGGLLNGHTGLTTSFQKGSQQWYRARFAGFTQSDAQATCSKLKRLSVDCLALRAD